MANCTKQCEMHVGWSDAMDAVENEPSWVVSPRPMPTKPDRRDYTILAPCNLELDNEGRCEACDSQDESVAK